MEKMMTGIFVGNFETVLTALVTVLGAVAAFLWWRSYANRRHYEDLTTLKTELQLKTSLFQDSETQRHALQQELSQTLAQWQTAREQVASQDARLSRLATLEHLTDELNRNNQALQAKNAELAANLSHEKALLQEKITLLEEAQKHLTDAFQALSLDALRQNNEAFLQLAQHTFTQLQEQAQGDLATRQKEIASLVSPVKEALTNVDQKLGDLEKERLSAYHVLRQQVQDLLQSQHQLRAETSNLIQALKTPSVRGRWGEIQLKRVVEMAGMLAYCDFFEQVNVATSDQRLRPDMIIRLPGNKVIIVDAKAPLHAYLEAMDATDDTIRRQKLTEHARHVRQHISSLSRRGYWEQFDPTPDFVVLFLPGEMFFSAALQHDPSLIETGVQERVILATPTTLIAMLRAIGYGWRQEKLAANAKEIGELGRDLYKRLGDLGSHFSKLGRNLNQAVDSYNQTLGTLERRVYVTARRFNQLETFSEATEVPELNPVEISPRHLTAAELLFHDGDQEENHSKKEARS